VIRKKVFRFEYGSAEEPIRNISLSPESRARALLSARSSPAQLPIRRRASHRLSLVPTGKTFVPSSPANGRRNSSIGLGALGSSKVATGKSLLREELEEEHAGDEQDGNGIPLVDVVNGEEGDLVYLETKEEEEVMGRIELVRLVKITIPGSC